MSYVKTIRSNTLRSATVAALSATLFLGAALVSEAHAGNHGKQQARGMQPSSKQWTRTTTTQRTPTGHTSHSTVTRDDGKVATRDAVVVNDRTNRTRSVDATTTGFNGRTTTYSSDAQRTDTGYTRDVSRTLPNGQVNQHSVDATCDKSAQSCTKVVTRQNGG